MTTNLSAAGASPRSASSTVPEVKKFKPVYIWAAFGAAFAVLQIYVYTAWITGPNFQRTPVGPTPVPMYTKVSLTILTVVGLIVTALMVWSILIKPWIRERRITHDGIFLLVFVSVFWQDPISDFIVPQFLYNSWPFNRGSWMADVPGVIMPNAGRMAEPLLISFPMYTWVFYGVVLLANRLMRKARGRWPNLSAMRLALWTIATFVLMDLFWESLFIHTGFWTYPQIPSLAFSSGRWFQIAVFEPLMWGTVWAAWALLRYFKNDKGQTYAEHGIESVRGSETKRSILRFLALSGICNLIMLGYMPPSQALALHATAPPAELADKSYFLNYLCGDGTDYACADGTVPFARLDSAHLNAQGELERGNNPPPPRVPHRTR